MGDRGGEGVAPGGQKLAPHPMFCFYRNQGGPLGSQAELPAGKSLPQRPLQPSHRPSCARRPSPVGPSRRPSPGSSAGGLLRP